MVRAKFKCTAVKATEDGNIISMVPVTGGSKENESFFNYTPFGELEMGIMNPAIKDEFLPGKEYYVDFSPAQQAGGADAKNMRRSPFKVICKG